MAKLKFEIGCDMQEFKPYYDKCGIVEQPGIAGGELTPDWEQLLIENPQWLIIWRLDGKIVGHAVWHESSTEEHRKGDRRDEEDRLVLERLLDRKGDVVELHEVWLTEEYRGRGYGKLFFEFFEGFMRERGFDSVIYYAFHPAALAICRQRKYKEAYFEKEKWYVFYMNLVEPIS